MRPLWSQPLCPRWKTNDLATATNTSVVCSIRINLAFSVGVSTSRDLYNFADPILSYSINALTWFEKVVCVRRLEKLIQGLCWSLITEQAVDIAQLVSLWWWVSPRPKKKTKKLKGHCRNLHYGCYMGFAGYFDTKLNTYAYQSLHQIDSIAVCIIGGWSAARAAILTNRNYAANRACFCAFRYSKESSGNQGEKSVLYNERCGNVNAMRRNCLSYSIALSHIMNLLLKHILLFQPPYLGVFCVSQSAM